MKKFTGLTNVGDTGKKQSVCILQLVSLLKGQQMPVNMQSFCVASAVALAACAPLPETTWQKSGATQNDFSTDRYACLQESQQRVSNATVNGYGGRADSGVITNGNLFAACMNARGWYLAMQQSAVNTARASYIGSDEYNANDARICQANNQTSDEVAQCMRRLSKR